MWSPTTPDAAIRLRATHLGPVATRALREEAGGEVRAVFERSFYVSFGDTWVCIGPPGLGNGPLNVLCEGWPGDMPASRVLGPGDPVVIRGRTLRIGTVLTVALGQAQRWAPTMPQPVDRARMRRGLAALSAALPETLPPEGVALLLRTLDGSSLPPVAHAATGPMRQLEQLIRVGAAVERIDAELMSPLLGLGPGLTPSGDDFVGGAMVALSLVGKTRWRDALWAALRPLVPSHTTEISAAHLAAAAEGVGSAALHDLLGAVIAADATAIPRALDRVAAIGHTSGWDALVGAVAVLRACADDQPADP